MDTANCYHTKRQSMLVPILNLLFFSIATVYFLLRYDIAPDKAALASVFTSIFAGSVSFIPLATLLKTSTVIIDNETITVFGKIIQRSSLISIKVLIAEVYIYYLNEKKQKKVIRIKLNKFDETSWDNLSDELKGYLNNLDTYTIDK